MNTLRHFMRSPLGRHPRLLARKIASRLGLYREDAPVPKAAVEPVSYPVHWADILRRWLQQVPFHPGLHPFARVFGQDFDEAFLLRLCRDGPMAGTRGLTGDIKLIWDYSRAQPLFTNAAADPARLEACVEFLKRWQAANPNANGWAWNCPMDMAIRAVNWIFADVLLEGRLAEKVGRDDWAAALWQHGHLIWRRLETRLISSNHYLANLLGLFVIGAVFPGDGPARRWRRFARDDFPRALLAQTRPDGGLNEASLRYHALVTEMALLFRLALGTPLPVEAEGRLLRMVQIVADFESADGDVFPFGDDDSGRVLGVDFASPVGRVEVLLRLAGAVLGAEAQTGGSAVCPDSGWWVRRAGDFTVAFEFGGVGMQGLGAHAHNDDFSFCLEWRGQPMIIDPGTGFYTGDPETRNRFRSVRAHNTVAVDGQEPRPPGANVFALPGDDLAYPATRLDDDTWSFSRQLADGVVHRREVSCPAAGVRVRDELLGSGTHDLEWRFHLPPAVEPTVVGRGFLLKRPGAGTLSIETATAELRHSVEPSEFSPGYGRRVPSQVCLARGRFALPMKIEWNFQP